MPTVAYSILPPPVVIPRLPVKTVRPASGPPARRGDWHYHGVPAPARIPWASLLIAAGLHALVLLGFNHHTAVAKTHVKEVEVIQMVIPEIKDLDEPAPTELKDEADKTPAMDVPTLADSPGIANLDLALVQPLDLRPPIQTDLNAAKVMIIPVNIAHGPRSDGGLKNIFNLAELDRIPQAISQVPPHFPSALKQAYSHAEVLVEFIVDADGKVRAATVVTSTAGGFDQPALDGVSKWRFRPGMKAGHRVNTRMRVPIKFQVIATDES